LASFFLPGQLLLAGVGQAADIQDRTLKFSLVVDKGTAQKESLVKIARARGG